MRRFAQLYDALDATTSTNAKVLAMRAYFADAPAADAAWAVFFLIGARLKRLIAPRLVAGWALEETGTAGWMFEECYSAAGDVGEVIALLIDARRGGPPPPSEGLALSRLIEDVLLPLRDADEARKREAVVRLWSSMPAREIFLLVKLLTGEFRVGVSRTLAVRALAQHAGLEPRVVEHRLMGTWEPSARAFEALVAREDGGTDLSRPYPFFLASPLEEDPSSLGEIAEWQAEWKWDGIRAQLVRRAGQSWLWSRGEELITARFPDLEPVFAALGDGTVLDGEVLAFRDGAPLPFSVLQRRIGRQKLTEKILAEAPAAFMAYDLLEEDGIDLRDRPMSERRERLLRVATARAERLTVSPEVEAASWEELAALRRSARTRGVEGLMLKRRSSPYQTGRRRGDWWKWKIDPYSIDAVLVYAQPGNGRRASVLTDMTFAVWHEGELLPVAKAYSGLTDEEIDRIDRWIRQHTIERFGPVRHVEPSHVFELHFEGIAESARHKSGIAVRFPRIARWRTDKKPEEADTLESLRTLLRQPKL
ncbi:MAG: ATP-dependent DNA ligase [Myxococcales bacterium]